MGYFATEMNRALVDDPEFTRWLTQRTPPRDGATSTNCGEPCCSSRPTRRVFRLGAEHLRRRRDDGGRLTAERNTDEIPADRKALTADVREVAVPEPGEGQVRLRVEYVGICGSDLHYYLRRSQRRFRGARAARPGHELSGRVDLDPSGAPVAEGTRGHGAPRRFGTPREGIENAPHLWPGGSYLGTTWPHTQGAASEYLIVEADMVRVLPEGLPVRRAVLAEPLAVALHALVRPVTSRARGAGLPARGHRLMAVAAAVAPARASPRPTCSRGPSSAPRPGRCGDHRRVDRGGRAELLRRRAGVLGRPVSISTALKAGAPEARSCRSACCPTTRVR